MCRNKGWNTCCSMEGKSSGVNCVDALLVDQLFSDFSWWDCFIFWWYYICLRGHSFYFWFQEILHFSLINEISCITESWIWALSIYLIAFQHFKKRTRILNAVTFCIFIFYNKSAFFILKRKDLKNKTTNEIKNKQTKKYKTNGKQKNKIKKKHYI